MLVKQIWTANSYRNFNYLIACPETGEALAIDPLDHEKCLQVAKAEGWQITQILNTQANRNTALVDDHEVVIVVDAQNGNQIARFLGDVDGLHTLTATVGDAVVIKL